MIGCLWHEAITWDESYSTSEHKIPFGAGPNLVEAIEEYELSIIKRVRWYKDESGQTFLHYDKDPWPANEGCSHLTEHMMKGAKDEPSMEEKMKQMQYEQQERERQRRREEDEDL